MKRLEKISLCVKAPFASAWGVAALLSLAALSSPADTVWLDEKGLWERLSSFHGCPYVVTNGQDVGTGRVSRGVVACPGNVLILGLFGEARRFTATVGQKDSWSKAIVRFRVWRENELLWESKDLASTSMPEKVSVDLAGARWVKLEMVDVYDGWRGWSVWGDAAFEMNPGRRPQDVASLSRQLGVLTPPAKKGPRINTPACWGVRPGNPVLYRVPVAGERPMKIEIDGLDRAPGLAFDAASQTLTGAIAERGDYPLVVRASNAHGSAERRLTVRVGEKIALTPPLGWNSWNAFGPAITGEKVRQTADQMKELGLLEHGWAYLTIDDGWQYSAKEHPAEARRAEDDTIKVNDKFADIKALADYVHARGLKFGIYSSPGPTTCANYEGSWMHEKKDAETFAKWGVDYLKYDWCSYPSVAFGEGLERRLLPYALMSMALRGCGRDIVHSICQYGRDNVSEWGGDVGGQCWRTTPDKFDFWDDVMQVLVHQAPLWRYSRPGAWNDPDMMLIGKTRYGPTRLTPNEQYTHVSMWAMMCAPMMIGCNLADVDDFTLSLLTNDEVLAIDQDELGAAAAPIDRDGDVWIWAKPMADGAVAIAFVNLSPEERTGAFSFARNMLRGRWHVRDVWRQADVGTFANGYQTSVPGHATTLLMLRPVGDACVDKSLRDVRDNYWRRRIEAHRPIDGASPVASKPASSDCDCGW